MGNIFHYKGYKLCMDFRGGVVERISLKGLEDEYIDDLPHIDPNNLDLSGFTDFQWEVLLTVMRIPPGKVATYKTVAQSAGRPGAFRAVGNIMAGNPFPIAIPCHRVIRSDLLPGNYSGGRDIKYDLLQKEGVEIHKGKVDKKFVLESL